jgi:hypothetical protein
MLPDPLVLAVPNGTDQAQIMTALHAVSHSGPFLPVYSSDITAGGSKRIGTASTGTDQWRVSVAHSLSKENPTPYVTQRSTVRLDRIRADADGKVVTASAYLVCALPQGTLFSDAEKLELVRALCLHVLCGQRDGSALCAATDQGLLIRILRGEP